MADGQQMEWPVPVVTRVTAQRRQMTVLVGEDHEVVLAFGEARVTLPPTSDEQLCDAIRDARRYANDSDMWG